MKKKLLSSILIVVMAISLAACGSEKEETEEETTKTEDTTEEDSSDEMSQSEWMEEHADDMEDGYEIVDGINIDSGDTKLEYTSCEKYTLQNGEEIFLVNFVFSNINAGTTSLDSQYNFRAFQNGVEITIYSTLYDEIDGDINRRKEILDGASIDISIGIAPDNWSDPIKLRVDDEMLYDEPENRGHTFQQQELLIQ